VSIKKAVQAQIEAKIDIITDGQIKDLFTLIASNVPGMGPNVPGMEPNVPRMGPDGHVMIKSKLGVPLRPTVAVDFLVAAKCSDAQRVKAVLPGPFMFAKNCQISPQSPYRGNFDADLLFDIASVIRFEIDALKEKQGTHDPNYRTC